MLTHSLQPCTRLNRLQTTFPRQAGFVRFPFSVVNPFMWRRPVCNETDPPTIIESAFNIEEAIRCLIDSQPAQLYRGGA